MERLACVASSAGERLGGFIHIRALCCLLGSAWSRGTNRGCDAQSDWDRKAPGGFTGDLGTGGCQPIRGTHRLLDAHFQILRRQDELLGALPPPLCPMAQFPVPGTSTHHLEIHSASSKSCLTSHLLPSCQLVFLLWVWPAPGQSCLLSPVSAPTTLGTPSLLGGCQGC